MEIINQDKQTGLGNNPPRKTKVIEILLKTNPEHRIARKFIEQEKAYNEKMAEYFAKISSPEPTPLPELKPIDVESFYDVFKAAFKFFRGKDFDENANNAESRKLARTVAAYLIGKKGFTQSPLLWKKINPDAHKGLMIIGNYGTGKTSILQTYHEMLRYALANPTQITVKDVEGNNQILARYKIGFGYLTANEVVKNYEAASSAEEKEIFWKRMSIGMKYFDDVMTENVASNYGKVELFKSIFEERYVSGAKTIISLNYSGESVDDTLDAFGNRYGERVYDRIKEMFNIVELKGRSLRK